MSGFIISQKLTLKEAIESMPKMEQWFKENPNRKFCNTDTFRVRRGYTATDILKHTNLNN